MCAKVAVVTGANKGIGLEIVKELCRKFDGDVILTARNEKFGRSAVEKLQKENNLSPIFHQLDVTDTASIQRFKAFLEQRYGGLDVLINNAGLMDKHESPVPFSKQARDVMGVNFWGCLNCCKILFPILHPGGRAINIASMLGRSTLHECAPHLRSKLTSQNISMEELEKLMEDFERCAETGTCEVNGWPKFAYGVSKIGVTVMTQILQREMDKSGLKSDVLINCCCPGWCQTDMGGTRAPRTASQGADTPVYLALLPPNAKTPRGALLSDRMVQKWE